MAWTIEFNSIVITFFWSRMLYLTHGLLGRLEPPPRKGVSWAVKQWTLNHTFWVQTESWAVRQWAPNRSRGHSTRGVRNCRGGYNVFFLRALLKGTEARAKGACGASWHKKPRKERPFRSQPAEAQSRPESPGPPGAQETGKGGGRRPAPADCHKIHKPEVNKNPPPNPREQGNALAG